MNSFIRTNNPMMLIIDGKEGNLAQLAQGIKIHGFNCAYESNANNAMKMIASSSCPSVVVISEDIFEVSAIEMCYFVRSHQGINKPVILIIKSNVSGVKEVTDTESGPSTYIAFDGDYNELISRIKYNYMIHRNVSNTKLLRYGDIEMNLNSFMVNRGGKAIRLGPTEFKILQCLLEYPQNVLSREFIMSYVWGKTDTIEPRTVDVHINRLRNSLRLSEDELPVIETIRALGYCLRRNLVEA